MGAQPLIIYDSLGNIVCKFNSQNEAALFLGVATTTLRRYTNLKNFPVFSTTLNQYIFPVYERFPTSFNTPNYSNVVQYAQIEGIEGIDLTTLEYGKLIAFKLDKVTVYGTFKNAPEAAKLLENKTDSKYISRYINLDRPVTINDSQGLPCNCIS